MLSTLLLSMSDAMSCTTADWVQVRKVPRPRYGPYQEIRQVLVVVTELVQTWVDELADSVNFRGAGGTVIKNAANGLFQLLDGIAAFVKESC